MPTGFSGRETRRTYGDDTGTHPPQQHKGTGAGDNGDDRNEAVPGEPDRRSDERERQERRSDRVAWARPAQIHDDEVTEQVRGGHIVGPA